MPKDNLIYLFAELWGYLSLKRKVHLVLVLMLSVFASISEMISIASVLPFLFVLMGDERSNPSNLPFDINYLLGAVEPHNQTIFLAM